MSVLTFAATGDSFITRHLPPGDGAVREVGAGDPFGMPTWLRVTIGTEPMNARFISALREILEIA